MSKQKKSNSEERTMSNTEDLHNATTGPEADSQVEENGQIIGETGGESASQTELEQLREKVKSLEEENSDLKEQYLRKQADFENYRKRMTREKEGFASYANKQLLLDLIPIIDDFERAIKSAEESKDFDSFHDGILLIEKQFTSMLERKWGLKRFESEGEEFDPQKHEAVMTEESADHDTSTVLEDFQKGYFLHDKVLRPSKVKVSVPVESETQDKNE